MGAMKTVSDTSSMAPGKNGTGNGASGCPTALISPTTPTRGEGCPDPKSQERRHPFPSHPFLDAEYKPFQQRHVERAEKRDSTRPAVLRHDPLALSPASDERPVAAPDISTGRITRTPDRWSGSPTTTASAVMRPPLPRRSPPPRLQRSTADTAAADQQGKTQHSPYQPLQGSPAAVVQNQAQLRPNSSVSTAGSRLKR